MTIKEHGGQRFGMERNLAAKLLDVLPIVYGERGKIGLKLYEYFSWVDDMIDEDVTMSNAQKEKFLDRQLDLTKGISLDDPHPMERTFMELPWDTIPKEQIREQSRFLLHAIRDDVDHMPLVPRTTDELTLYHWETVIPILEIASLVINGKDFHMTEGFLELIKNWERKDHINHFTKDTAIGLIKLPLSPEDHRELSRLTSVREREAKLKEIFSPNKLTSMQLDNLEKMKAHVSSIWETDLPLSQKLIFTSYMWFRITSNTLKYSKKITGSEWG